MSLVKQAINIPFGQGLDLKTDKFQLHPGKMLSLVNGVFTKGGQLAKRYGNLLLPSIGDSTVNSLAQYGDALIAAGDSLYNYSAETQSWYNKGTFKSTSLAVEPLVRSPTSQTQQDVAVAPSGLACAVWSDSAGRCNYQVIDTASSQVIVANTALPDTAVKPRVNVVGSYFIITFLATVSAATHLRYIAIPVNTPTSPGSATDLATNAQSLTASYDATSDGSNLYYIYTTTTPNVVIGYMDRTLVIHHPRTLGASYATPLNTITIDFTSAVPAAWYLYLGTASELTLAVYQITSGSLSPILAPTGSGLAPSSPVSMTGTVQNNVITAAYALPAFALGGVSYNTLGRIVMDSTGAVTINDSPLNNVSLGSKGFVYNGQGYVWVAYGGAGSYQPTYFLVDTTDFQVISKLAYGNGGGYPASEVLPGVTVSGAAATFGYLFKDLIAPVNKTQGSTVVSAVYTQTGINLATLTFDEAQDNATIAQNLYLSGGQLWQYDGVKPVEQGFHIWPEGITAVWTATSTKTPTGTVTSGSAVVTAISSMAGLGAGMTITGTAIPASTTVLSVDLVNSTLTMSAAATGTHVAETITVQGHVAAQPDGATNTKAYFYQVTYEWTDGQGLLHRSAPSVPLSVTTSAAASIGVITLQIPILTLTRKSTPNPARIVIYRWSVAQQVYYQVTSITLPLLNQEGYYTGPFLNSQYVTYIDALPDSSILGNAVLYTTGGVLENIAAPAVADMTLFKSRLMLLLAEDRNSLEYSKQVIPATPVEFSDLQTLYVAPSIGSQGSTGKSTALSAMDDKLIIFKRNAIYYVVGNGPDITGGNNDFSDPVFITATVGCINPKSVVFQPGGLMFQSDKGIWLLRRDLGTEYVGAPVEDLTTGATVQSAVAIPGTNQVRFTLSTNTVLMYDYYFNQWGTFELPLPVSSSTLFQDLHVMLNSNATIFQENQSSYLDGSRPVLLSFQTAWLSLSTMLSSFQVGPTAQGGIQGYQRLTYLLFLGEYLSPFKLNIQLAYDFNDSTYSQATVSPDNFNPNYGDADGFYGAETPMGGNGQPFTARVFPTKQRCSAFRVTAQEVFDASYGTAAGAGFTLSGMTLVASIKKGYRPSSAAKSFG